MCFAVWLTLPRVCVPAFVIEVLVSFMLGREASNTDSLSPSAVSVWPATLWSITTSSQTSSSSSSSSAAAHWLPRIQSEPTPSGTMWVYNVRSEVTLILDDPHSWFGKDFVPNTPSWPNMPPLSRLGTTTRMTKASILLVPGLLETYLFCLSGWNKTNHHVSHFHHHQVTW